MTSLKDSGISYRPLHPWLHHASRYPAPTMEGKGEFWHYGPNRTADSVILSSDKDPSIVFIRRQDNGLLALPGGFVDTDETAYEAAIREAFEESGVCLDNIPGSLFYDGPVADHRATKHAWPHTSAFVFTVEKRTAVRHGDDATDALWVKLSDIPSHLHGSHWDLIIRATTHSHSTPSAAEYRSL